MGKWNVGRRWNVERMEHEGLTVAIFSVFASLSTGPRVTSDSDNRSSLIISWFVPISLWVIISGGNEWRVSSTDWSIPGGSLLSSIWVSGSYPKPLCLIVLQFSRTPSLSLVTNLSIPMNVRLS